MNYIDAIKNAYTIADLLEIKEAYLKKVGEYEAMWWTQAETLRHLGGDVVIKELYKRWAAIANSHYWR